MALKIWLPLDGDLRNLGASDVEVINNGATVDNSGKIGKCYNTTNGPIIISNLPNPSSISISFWMKRTSNTNTRQFMFTAWNGVTCELTTDGTITWAVYRNNYPTITASAISTSSGWVHYCGTFSSTDGLKLYINGELRSSNSNTTAISWSTTSGQIGKYGSYASASMLINDFRIYDHCLSAAEVHEIAMGLVLHYKLDGNGFGNPNLLANSKLDGSWTYPSSSYSDKYSPITTSIPAASQYTLSFEAKSTVNGDKIRTHYYSPNTTTTCVSNQGVSKVASDGNMDFTLTTNWEKYWVIYSQNETTAVKHIICPRLVSGNGTGTVSVRNVKLEEGNIATPWCPNVNDDLYKILGMNDAIIEDSSGYGHNAILTNGSLTTDTPRYSEALILDSSTKAIGTPIFKSGVFIPEYTWAGWVKRNYTTASAKQIHANIANINLYTDFTPYISWTSGKTDGSTTGNGATGGSATTILNEWDHMAITYKSGIGKFYINGELIRTWDYSSYGVYIAAYENNTLGNGFIGNLSDIRIYTTELLDTDIKLLYNVGMRADNLQNLHTFEYKENTSNLFRSELIMPFAKTGYTEGNGNITIRNESPAMDIRAHIFYQNLENSTSGFLKGYFKANTSYVFDMWIDTDAVIYNGNNVAGGLVIIYTDGTSENTFVFTGGNKGWQHKIYITPNNKTIDRISVYYYVGQPVYCRLDSCICPLNNLKLHKTGIFEGANLLEETNTKLIKNALIETNEIIEM